MKVHPFRFHLAVTAALLLTAGASHANAPEGRYASGNGTVYDTKTQLTWQHAGALTVSYGGTTSAPAADYCSTLNMNGTVGWRLPTVGELLTLVDYSQAGNSTAMIDPTFFPQTPAGKFWSSTPMAVSTSYAWLVDFGIGWTDKSNNPSNTTNYVRCVR